MIKLDLASVKKWVLKNPITFECLLIFLSCVFVYLANDQSSASGDTWSNSQLAFNWLFNNTLNFDDFRAVFSNRHLPHSLAEAPNGHLTSTYPIGPVIVTFPLYVIFSAYLRLIDWLHQFSSYLDIPGVSLGSDIPSITDSEFQSYRASFSKLAATLSTSLSVVIFYLAVRLKFNIFIALITTFIFAFATGTWTVSSQHMLQHGISNLELASIMLCLLKVHRSEGKNRKILLLTAGFFCGLLPATRPPCLLFVMAIVFYSLFTYRRDAVFFLVGCLSFLLGGIWNTYYFGFSFKTLIYGGYINHAKGNFGLSSYIFSLDQFLKIFLGLTVSPSRGVFIFSPILLFCFYGVYKVLKLRHHKDEALLACLSIAAGVVFLQYCFYRAWGVGTYGARFPLDTIVPACYLLAYSFADLIGYVQNKRNLWNITLLSVFFVFMLFSTAVQAIGAFGGGAWRSIPIAGSLRFWDWKDSEIARNANYIYFEIFDPIEDSDRYLEGLGGSIEQITDERTKQPISTPLVVKPSQRLFLGAIVKNTGTEQWFGYETSVDKGATRISVKFFDADGEKVKIGEQNELYVSGTPKTGKQTRAIGFILFPSKPGNYKTVFQLRANRIDEFPSQHHQPIELIVEVKAN